MMAPGGLKRLSPLLLLLAAVGALSLGARVTDLGRVAELKTVDWRFRRFSEPARRDPSIVLVMIDQASLDHFEKDGVYWPWPRSIYGAALSFLKKGGARVAVLDILFTNPSSIGADQDAELARSFKDFGRVVVAMETGVTPHPLRATPPPARFAVPAPAWSAGVPAKAAVRPPIPELSAAAERLGDTAMPPDLDGVFRRVPLAVRLGDAYYPTLPAAAAMSASGKSLDALAPPWSDGTLAVRFHGKAVTADPRLKTYPVYPIGSLISGWQALSEGKKPELDPGLFKDKVVFFGMTAAGLLDNRPSPVSPVFSGTEILAAATDNLLNRDFLRAGGTASAAALVLAALLAAGLASRLSKYAWMSFGLTAAASAVLAGVSVAAFRHGLVLDAAAPQLALWLGFAAASAWSYAVEGRQHRYIQGAFGHYLSPEIVRRISESPESLRLGGERREVTFYFSDIAGFTTFSEKLEPEALTKLMNTYLGEMTDTVLETGGTLDKYIGDAVMAFWGAPLPMKDHALVACKVALANQRKLARLREEWTKAGWPPVRNRIGLNSGPAIIGNMGSPKRFSYTAIGDNVNLASRLEGANKPYGTGIMISESTRLAAGDAIEVRELDYIKVKGKNLPIRVYELLGLKGETDPRQLDKARRFEEGLALLRARRLDEAEAAFRAVEAEHGADESCELFLERCAEVRREPPPPDWDGSFALTEK
ncbi:MAG: adenylate/guanylate cyclase domain-containing protein [Elusimicrobiota bacterium]|nr:adenylate/guanylate cyclase domain-containing protein [Elusimicrobiota bacterium]